MNLFNIKDKVIVISGGTGVLGASSAKSLANSGAKIIILGRKQEVRDKLQKMEEMLLDLKQIF